jgi:hypothetical protein
MCSTEKSASEQFVFVADGAKEVTPNDDQEGQSDFR